MADRDTKEVREQRAAEQLERDKIWYDAQRAEAKELATRAGELATALIDELGDDTYSHWNYHGLEARISSFVEIPGVEAANIGINFGRIFVAYSIEQTEDRPRRRWFRRAPPAVQPAPGVIARVGVHYYSRPDAVAYRGATVLWDGTSHGSVADANLTLGVLQDLADLHHTGPTEEL